MPSIFLALFILFHKILIISHFYLSPAFRSLCSGQCTYFKNPSLHFSVPCVVFQLAKNFNSYAYYFSFVILSSILTVIFFFSTSCPNILAISNTTLCSPLTLFADLLSFFFYYFATSYCLLNESF